MIRRWLESDIQSAMQSRRGVFLTGARQTGKTTLASMLNLAKVKRVTLDNEGSRTAAQYDPISFVERGENQTLIIDEVQKAVGLLDAVKMRLDNDQSKGQYLLTGSSNLRFSKAVKDSLAGRLATIRLRPMTLAEQRGRNPSFLEKAFQGIFVPVDSLDKKSVVHQAFIGGYPEQLDFSIHERRRWFKDYITDLLTKDVKDITEIRKVDVLKDVAIWLLAHSAQFFTLEDLCTRSGISKITAENYLEVLRALYMFDRIPAWAKSDYDRIGKRAKWVACDTGLMASALRWNEDEVLEDSQCNGKLVETWVYNQLVAQADLHGEYEITQYRDKDKREIDFLVENDRGELLGIEVKAGALVGNEDLKHLRWFAENLAKSKFHGIVMYAGNEVMSFGDGMYAVPLSCLA